MNLKRTKVIRWTIFFASACMCAMGIIELALAHWSSGAFGLFMAVVPFVNNCFGFGFEDKE